MSLSSPHLRDSIFMYPTTLYLYPLALGSFRPLCRHNYCRVNKICVNAVHPLTGGPGLFQMEKVKSIRASWMQPQHTHQVSAIGV